MTITPIDLPGFPPTSEEPGVRIEKARAHLPYLRDLHELKDILHRQPLLYGLADRVAEVEGEIKATEALIVKDLYDGA